MNENYFKHLLHLIIPMEYLLSKEIQRNKLDLIEQSLIYFVENLESLYDEHALKSAAHELLHLVECTKTLGPLNQDNCFAFEELNRKITRFIKSQDLVGDEFLKLSNAAKNFQLYIDNFDENETENKFIDYIKSNFEIKSTNKKKQINKNVSYLKLGLRKNNVNLSYRFISYLKDKINLQDENDLFFFESVRFNNIIYSIEKETKYSNNVISFEKKFGLITYIFKTNEICYFLCTNLVQSNSLFYTESKLKSNFSFFTISNSYFLLEQNQFYNLNKHFMYNNSENILITNYMGNHLFSKDKFFSSYLL